MRHLVLIYISTKYHQTIPKGIQVTGAKEKHQLNPAQRARDVDTTSYQRRCNIDVDATLYKRIVPAVPRWAEKQTKKRSDSDHLMKCYQVGAINESEPRPTEVNKVVNRDWVNR